MALDLDRVGVDLLAGEAELEQMVRGEQAGDDCRRAGAEAAGERDLTRDPEGEPVGGMQALERPHAEVAAVARDVALHLDPELAGLGDLELEEERERGGQHVVPRAEVRRRRRHPDDPATLCHRRHPRARINAST